MAVKVRQALSEDLPWINERYKEVEFVPSDESDYIAIAEIKNRPVGIGRIADVGGSKGELGGMYVFEDYRGSGVAREIIKHLLDNARFEALYCLPFENLESFYASFGFQKAGALDNVPSKVLEKYRWCNKFYTKPVLLMQRVLRGSSI